MAKKQIQEEEDIVILGNESEKETDIAKCPSCGANMVFNPETQVLKCDHCGTEQTFEVNGNAEQSFSKLLEGNSTWSDETHVFTCSNCGAKEIVGKSDISKECSFCGTSNVVKSDELSGIKPNAVVPFKISLENAADKAVAWAKKRFFAPSRFKKHLSAEDVKGLYNPAFTFDTDTVSAYKGRLGRYYTETVTRNGKKVQVRKIRYFNVSGCYSIFFDDILIQASTVIRQKDLEKIAPFGTNESKEYTKEFLHGYSATQYTKDGMTCWGEAKKVIDKSVRAGILRKYSYDVVDYLKVNTQCNRITYKYLLLPIYIGHFNYGKKLYNFFVSGYSGKVAGKAPVSPLKVSILTLIIGGLLVGGYFLFRYFAG